MSPRFASWPPAVRDIAAMVAEKHSVTVDDLRAYSRVSNLVRARQEAFAVAWRAGHSLPEIGAYFRRDHKTVHHGVRRHEARP